MADDDVSTAPAEHPRYHLRTSPYLELDTCFTSWEAFKMVVLLPLVLIRLLAMGVLLLLFALVSTIAVAGWPMNRPLPSWRRQIVLASRWLGGAILFLLGFWLQLHKAENIRKAQLSGVKIFVFNHISWVDTIVLLFLFAPSGVSRASNASIPIVGTCIRSFQNISVPQSSLTRKRPASNGHQQSAQPLVTASTAGVVHQVAQRLKDPGWPIIGIAPEGTTSNGRGLLQFRTGAFVHGVPVLPVCISYSRKCVNPAWTIGNEPWHFLRVMGQFFNVVRVEVLPPYTPTEAEVADPALFAENVRKQMAAALQVPLIEQNHSHYKALLATGITTNWRGKLVVPKAVQVDARGCIDLEGPGRRER